MNYRVIFSDELYHYGTKGMKWGVRRFQYIDGKRTPEGKERYSAKIVSQASGGGGGLIEKEEKDEIDKKQEILKLGLKYTKFALIYFMNARFGRFGDNPNTQTIYEQGRSKVKRLLDA